MPLSGPCCLIKHEGNSESIKTPSFLQAVTGLLYRNVLRRSPEIVSRGDASGRDSVFSFAPLLPPLTSPKMFPRDAEAHHAFNLCPVVAQSVNRNADLFIRDSWLLPLQQLDLYILCHL